MVRELSTSGLHECTHELEERDVRAVEGEINDSTACRVESVKIMNPPDRMEGLHISIVSDESEALTAERTMNHLHDAAVHVGYDGNHRDAGLVLEREDGVYVRSFYFTSRKK